MACLGMFGLCWAVGYLICRAALAPTWHETPVALRLGLGWAAGAAFAGMATFWSIVLTPGRRETFVASALALGLASCLVRPAAPDRVPEPVAGERGRRWRWRSAACVVGASAFAAVLALWVARCLTLGVRSPAGGWDAFSIWNQRARFFYFCPEQWTRACDPALEWSHPEYPNLLPSLIVYGWLPEGRCVALSPVAVALLTQVAKLLLLVGLTQAAYPRSAWPWAFGVFYATIPQEWTQEEAWQYADRPLSVFLLAVLGSLALGLRQGRRRWYLLAGLCWGAAGFCKDEGKAALVLLALGAALATACSLSHGGGWRAIGNLALLLLGLVPGLASLGLQWARSPIPTTLLERMTSAPLRDTGRTAVILRDLGERLDHPSWGWMWWGCALTPVVLGPWLRRRELWLLWLYPAAQLSVYLLIFQLTPQPLEWHLRSALPRLLFHIGPLVYLAATWLILECADGAGRDC